MNKTILQRFFAYEDEVVEVPVEVPQEEPQVDTWFEDEVERFDFLLKRNWFPGRDVLVDFLWEADEDVFQELMKRMSTYPSEVQEVLFSFLPRQIKTHLKVRVLTQEEANLREIQDKKDRKKRRDDLWELFKVQQNLQPPAGPLDQELEELVMMVQHLQKEIESIKKKTMAGRYVPPSARGNKTETNPKVLELEKKIQTVENEIEIQKQLIEQSHHEWFIQRRNRFEREMLVV